VNSSPSTTTERTEPPAVEWIRKRDGEVARFELDKLIRSLQLAAGDCQLSLPPDAVAELARMASFFVRANASGDVVASDEVAEWVEKSLRETAQFELADSYRNYRARKLWARTSLIVAQDRHEPDVPGTAEPCCWNKLEIVQALRTRLNLDARRSRGIAGEIERSVLRGGFTRLTTSLIREIVNNALGRWGVDERLVPSQQVWISTSELKRQLARPAGPAVANRMVAGRIWRDFALNEVVSREVADAERRGLLRIHGLESPATLAAACVDCCALVRQAQGSRESVTQFGFELTSVVESTATLVAIEGVEPWLTLVAEPKDSPAKLAELVWIELQSRMRNSPIQCVLNLYGGLPPSGSFATGAGPLFSQQPLSAEREFAGAVSQEILGLFQRDGGDWPNLRVDWHWYLAPDPVQSALIQRIMRVIAAGLPVAIAYDRGPVPLGEGLRRLGESIRPVLDYVGVSLPQLWRDAGSPRSLPALEDGLRQTIQLAVRAAVQKREFVRRLPRSADSLALDSAVLAIFPIGLDWLVRQLVGRGFAEDEGSLKLAESLVRYLRDAAEREARHFALGVVIDSPGPSHFVDSAPGVESSIDNGQHDEGLNPYGRHIGLRRQIHAAGRLHAVAQAGTLTASRADAPIENIDRLMETIDWTCRNSELVRLRLVTDRQFTEQAMVIWPDS
jgi:transcriptional regulator NrdR family protein